MCGLFGFLNYSNKDIKGLSDLTNALAEHSSIRGTDATGISFVSGDMIRIIKEAKAAENIDFKHPENLKALIGHTRHSTQGSEKGTITTIHFMGRQT